MKFKKVGLKELKLPLLVIALSQLAIVLWDVLILKMDVSLIGIIGFIVVGLLVSVIIVSLRKQYGLFEVGLIGLSAPAISNISPLLGGTNLESYVIISSQSAIQGFFFSLIIFWLIKKWKEGR